MILTLCSVKTLLFGGYFYLVLLAVKTKIAKIQVRKYSFGFSYNGHPLVCWYLYPQKTIFEP